MDEACSCIYRYIYIWMRLVFAFFVSRKRIVQYKTCLHGVISPLVVLGGLLLGSSSRTRHACSELYRPLVSNTHVSNTHRPVQDMRARIYRPIQQHCRCPKQCILASFGTQTQWAKYSAATLSLSLSLSLSLYIYIYIYIRIYIYIYAALGGHSLDPHTMSTRSYIAPSCTRRPTS
jgi:hypothetical protein